MRLFVRTALFLLLISHGWLRAAEYQWSVPMEPTIPDPAKHPRAFLWIPPTCQRVRAVVLGEHNMIEEGIFDSPIFRQAMSDLGFAIVWVSPSFDPVFRFDAGAGDKVDGLMKALAQESGYAEIADAPIVPIGHSAHASYPWNFAAWNPGRTLAILSVHGDAPLTNRTGSGRPNPDWGDRKIDGVPGLMVMGEYEWLQDRLDPAIDFHKKHPGAPLSVICDVGHGHFDYSDQLISYLTLFLRKAALARLPEDAPASGAPVLKAVDPNTGWLVDQWRHGKPSEAEAAPFANYAGDKDQAFWVFDREMAEASEHFNPQGDRLPQLLGFEQDGAVIPQVAGTHAQVTLKFEPLPDGITFHTNGVFIDTVPAGNPEKWTGLPAGSHIDHATGGGPVTVSRISGPVMQTGPDSWAVHFYRGSDVTDYGKLTDEIWLLAKQEGDDKYRSAVEQALMTIHMHNLQGSDQHITFPSIPNQTNATGFLKLAASSDSGLPVSYYVREGPAEIEGNTLRFTPVPPRAKYPIKVTVVAWQYGSPTSPRVKSAEPVAQVFMITK